jgi:hypothetical protein
MLNINQINGYINDLPFNDVKINQIFKYIVKNKILYNRQSNNIFFDLNQLNQNQIIDINNILIK